MLASDSNFPPVILQVSWLVSDDRLNVIWDETEGPAIENVGEAGFAPSSEIGGSGLRWQDRDQLLEDRPPLHDAKCRIPPS